MTRDEWLASISADTGMTVQTILEARAKRGRYPVACDCGEDICQGWKWSDPPEDDLPLSVDCPACGRTIPVPTVESPRIVGRLLCALDGTHSWDVIDTSTWEDVLLEPEAAK